MKNMIDKASKILNMYLKVNHILSKVMRRNTYLNMRIVKLKIDAIQHKNDEDEADYDFQFDFDSVRMAMKELKQFYRLKKQHNLDM